MGRDKMKRAAIYVFHDPQKVVDRYVPVFLREMKRFVDHLLVVVNGEADETGMQRLRGEADEIMVRPNEGYDITGYKEGIRHIGWEKLAEYDELILVNSTNYGPLYPFDEMFETMSARDVDFWGITKHHQVDFDVFGTCKYGYVPEHIQSSFMVIRQPMLSGAFFKARWEELPVIHSYAEAIGFFEVIFTKEAVEAGFKADVYVNTDDLEGYTRYPLMMMSDELIIRRKCPVMKQKSFSQNYYDIITDTIGNATADTFRFIDEHTAYDIDLIWENILRIANMDDIKKELHLDYILPRDHRMEKAKAYPASHKPSKAKKRVALMMHLYYPDLVDSMLRYAANMPQDADLIISSPNPKTRELAQRKAQALSFANVIVLPMGNRGRDVSALLVALKPYVSDYRYVCFVHDKKTVQTKPYANGWGFAYKCMECNLASADYVENIIETFERNPRLGMLMPPSPNHGNFYQIIGQEWASNFDNTCALGYKLKLNVNIRWDREPITPLGTMFWFRPEALKTLLDYPWTYEDFPPEPNGFDGTLLHAIERIYGFVVQHEGFYPAWVMDDRFAALEMTNLHFAFREMNMMLLPKYPTGNLFDMVSTGKARIVFDWGERKGLKAMVKRGLKRVLPPKARTVAKGVYVRLKAGMRGGERK